MIVAAGGMGERRGGPGTALYFGEGRGAELNVVTESRQAWPGWGGYKNQF